MKTQKEIEKGCGKTISSDEGTCNYCGEFIKCETCQALLQQNKEFIKMIDWKIKDLKKRKPKLIGETSKYCMQMSIEELQELKSSIIGSEKKK